MSQTDSTEETIFDAARQLGHPDKQAAYLDLACGKDQALRQRIEELLRAGRRAKDFFQKHAATPPLRSSQTIPEGTISEGPGTIIGPYKLLQQIGEGGCGVVYMAQQEEPVRRRVALKVIKLGMDTKNVIARFEAERQALALMDHPNIARVLDAGATDSGRPFFVMELVHGIKITEFCDQKSLSMRERLDLFLQVCAAVQHAHQKGIIHRDLKPSNVLVTLRDGIPVPKVIDFGIAKATTGQPLTDKTVFTAFEQFIGTPAYMSPEQAEMSELGIDTRSDIYSLGVLLYELLTGQTPFDAKELLQAGLDAMRRTIREEEPPKPSTRLTQELVAAEVSRRKPRGARRDEASADSRRRLQEFIHLLRGDLDWIVMKCLEKDRSRRYETANSLATDIQRHLNCEPVAARPPSRLYEFQKTVRRHKFGFGAAGAVTAALMIGLAVSTWLLVKEKAARERALTAEKAQSRSRERAETEAAKSQQVAHFLKKMLEGVGPSKALGRDATMLREILDETAKSVGKDLTNQPEVAVELCLTLADTYHDLGLYKEMEGVARQSLQLARSRPGEENESVAASLIDVGDALQHLGELHAGSLEESEKYYLQGLAMRRKLLGNENPKVAVALAHLGNVLVAEGRLAEAETMLREALAMSKKLLGNEDPKVAKLLFDLAIVLRSQPNRLAEAESLNREALAMQRRLLAEDHPEVAKTLRGLAIVLFNEGKVGEAETIEREALAMWRKMQANDRIEVAWTLHELAFMVIQQGNLTEAETRQREALAMLRRLLGNQHDEVATSLDFLASVLQRQGKLAEAETNYREALAVKRKLLGNENPEVTSSLYSLANVLQQQGKLAEAEATYREILAIQRKLVRNEDPQVADSVYNLAFVLKQQGKPEAEALLREAAEHMNVQAMNNYSWRLATGPDSKFRDGVWAVCLSEKAATATNRKDPNILDTLAAAYAEAGQFTDAVRVQQEAMALQQISQERQNYASKLRLYQTKVPYREQGPLETMLNILVVQEKFTEAEPLARESLAQHENEHPGAWETFRSQGLLGSCLLGQKRFPEAEALLLSGYEGMEQRRDQIPVDAMAPLVKDAECLAHLYELTGQPEQAVEWKKRQAVALAAAQSASEVAARRASGVSHAQHGRFAGAVPDFAKAIELRPGDHEVWHWQAAVLVQSGQLDAYRELRRRSVERFGHTTDPNRAERIAKDYLILPSSEADLETVSTMAETAVSAPSNHPDMAWFQFCKGLAEYRQGHFAGAVDWTNKVLSHEGDNFTRDVEAYMVLAMAQYRSKQAAEAGSALAKGIEIAESKLPKLDSGDLGDGWLDWIIAHALMREAQALVGDPTPTQPK